MKPDRSNFEIWVADWLAGNLPEEQKVHFMKFLEQNPDLKDEADSLSLTILSPGKRSFESKGLLKKSQADLHSTQVEYLSVAYLEDDISPGQLEDLNNCINNNRTSRDLFETVRKIKLVPGHYRYSHKERLKKKTPVEKLFRISYTGLSIAATIAIIILISFLLNKELTLKQIKTTASSVQQKEPVILNSEVIKVPDEKISLAEKTKNTENPGSWKIVVAETNDKAEPPVAFLSDSSETIRAVLRKAVVSGISDFPDFRIDVLNKPAAYSLVASNIEFREPEYDDRNGLTKFLARTFREKILREDSGSDAPVKPYEIASAGINGLSRLFGLEMALVKVSDEQGEMKSLYFSSRLLKINTPVKKDEVLQ